MLTDSLLAISPSAIAIAIAAARCATRVMCSDRRPWFSWL